MNTSENHKTEVVMREKKSESELRRNFLGVRWSDAEMSTISAAAHDEWLSISSFIRQLVMQVLSERKEVRK